MSIPFVKLRSLVMNIGLLATGETISKVFTLVAFAHLARVLGPGSFGNVEFALAITFVFSLVIDLGLGVYGAREIAKNTELTASITQRVVTTRFWLTFISLGMIVLFVCMIRRPWEARQLLLLFGLTLVPAPLLLQWVFQGLDRMWWVSLIQIVRYGTFSLIVIAIVRGVAQAWIIPIAELVAMAVCVGINLGIYRYHFGTIRLQPLSRLDRALIIESLPIGLSQFMWAVKFFFATVLLGLITKAEDVGQFSAALRIIIALHTFIALYFYNLLPSVSRYGKESAGMLQALVGGSIRVSSWISLLGCVIGTVGATPIIQLIYGSSYEKSAIVLQLLLWMLGATFLSAHYRCVLIGCGRQGLELISTSIGAGLNVVLVVLLYPRFGLAGAALAMLISELVIGALAYHFVNCSIVSIGVWRHLRQPAIVALALALSMYLTAANPLWLKMCVALVLFVAGLRLFDPQMLTALQAILVARPTGGGGATG